MAPLLPRCRSLRGLLPRPRFVLRLGVEAPPDQAWRRLWDLDRHTGAVPLTTVATAGGAPLGAGTSFTARTVLGPVAVDDVMVVREWRPPHRAVVAKTGRLLGGTITAELHGEGPATVLRWEQEYTVRGLPGPVSALAVPLVRAGYARTLRRITR